jgi:hypothetical protein
MSKKDMNKRITIDEKMESESTNRIGAAAACSVALLNISLRRWDTWAYQSGTDPIVTNDTTTSGTMANGTMASAPTAGAVRGKLRASSLPEGM